ncbi:MAG: hypothetical protein MJ239_01625 [Bacilli bacterium]|nr:hypothetical protein [Bacilli bacterium]
MKSKIILISAFALISCGAQNTSSSMNESVEIGASVFEGVVVNYQSDENLLGVSVLSRIQNGAYVYTPKVNDIVYLVPSFMGSNELDHMIINGEKYEAQTGTDQDVFETYNGPLSLKGFKYCSYKQPNSKVSIDVVSKAVDGAKLHNVSLNIVDETTPADDGGLEITGSNLDSCFRTKGNHQAQMIEGSWVSYLIQGEDMDNYLNGFYSYSAKIGTASLYGNTIESSVNNWMKTTASFVMGSEDVVVDITMKNATK